MREAAKNALRPVHAYQLFSPADGPMDPKKVAARFKEQGWKMLSHNQLFAKLVKPLLKEVELAMEREDRVFNLIRESIGEDRFEPIGVQKRVERSLQEFFQSEAIDELMGDVTSLKWRVSEIIIEAISARLRTLVDETGSSDLSGLEQSRGFLKHVADWYPGEGSRMFRPHELFLFAEQHGIFKDLLITSQAHLSQGATVHFGQPSANIMHTWRRDLNEVAAGEATLPEE